MQFLESSIVGLRTARHALTHPSLPTRVSLYPMVHVGDPAFYQRVHAEALSHDVVLCEGVSGQTARRLTRAYRWANVGRLGLMVQPAISESSGTRVVRADLDSEEFERLWADAPFHTRLAFTLGSSGYGLWMSVAGSRARLAERLVVEDLADRDDIYARADPVAGPALDVLLSARDARLCARFDDVLSDEDQSIAVLYGAGHMSALMRHLIARRGFRVRSSDWLTVFER
ncbi:hypothetical protein [Litorisediminicola beolgyonensis]